jgi:hypothetical protein
MSINSIRLVKNAKSYQQVSLVVLYNCNIHPSEQDKPKYAMLVINVPSTAKHTYINTFL